MPSNSESSDGVGAESRVAAPALDAVFVQTNGRDNNKGTSTAVAIETSEIPASAQDPAWLSVREEDIPDVLDYMIQKISFPGNVTATGGDGALDRDNTAILYDVDALRGMFHEVRSAFPSHWTHCYAVKSCPLAFVMRELVRSDLGVEAASFEELYLGLAHGCPPHKAVFDSPAKTYEELEMSLKSGALINANSLDELDRIENVISRLTENGGTPFLDARVGIRLNTLVGAGAIAEFSVSTATSKFGVPATETNINAVVNTFRHRPWLVGLHSHVGSQGCSLEQLGRGAAILCKVADTIDAELGAGRVTILDIGGGLPANYTSEQMTPTFKDYAAVLKREAPSLFSNTDRVVITEFGRAMITKTAFTVSNVEYLRVHEHASPGEVSNGNEGANSEGHECMHQTLITHMGADLFLRSSYCPDKFVHRFAIYDKVGKPLSTPCIRTELAGPLCFAGDYIGRNIQLPRASVGDLVVARDTGANTLAVFSRHCSRRAPPVYAYVRDGRGEVQVRLVKRKESVRDVARFWGSSV